MRNRTHHLALSITLFTWLAVPFTCAFSMPACPMLVAKQTRALNTQLTGLSRTLQWQKFIANVLPEERPHLFPKDSERAGMGKLRHLLRTGDWQASGYTQSVQAIEPALRLGADLTSRGQMSVDELSTLLFLWEAMTDLPYGMPGAATPIPLLDGKGKLTASAHAAFVTSKPSLVRYFGDKNGATSETELALRLEKNVRKLSPLQRYFWVFSYPLELVVEKKSSRWEQPLFANLFDRLFHFTKYLNGWHELDNGDKPSERNIRIHLPSVGLLRIVQSMRFGRRAMHAIPQLGITNAREITDQILENSRTLGFKFPGTTGLEMADHLYCGNLPYTFHDIFHLNWASSQLPLQRYTFVQFYKHIERIRSESYSVKIDGVRFQINSASSLPDEIDEIKGYMVDSDFAVRTDDFAIQMQHLFTPLRYNAGNSLLMGENGLAYFVIDMAKRHRNYEMWLGESMESLLARLDNLNPPGSIPTLSLYRAVRAQLAIDGSSPD